MIDSGSRDRSLEIVRAAGSSCWRSSPASSATDAPATSAPNAQRRADLLPHPGRHPVPGWLRRLPRGVRADERVGAAYGPHLPRADTSPMIARELTEFFAASRRGRASSARAGNVEWRGMLGPTPVLQRRATRRSSPTSTPATRAPAGRRSAFAKSPTPRTRPSAPTCSAAGWVKVYHPGAAVLHAHDYGASSSCAATSTSTAACARAPATSSPSVLAAARHVRAAVAGDRRWVAAAGTQRRRAGARWTARSATAPRGPARVLRAGLARRADFPAPVQQPALAGGARGDRRATAARRAPRRGLPPPQRLRRCAATQAPAGQLLPTTTTASSRACGGGPRTPAGAGPRHGRARAAAPGDGDPPVPPWQRGTQHAVSDLLPPGAARAHVQRVAGRLPQPAARRGRRVLRHDINEFFAPLRGARVQGLRPVAGRRCGDRHRLADGARRSASGRSAARVHMWSTTTSPSSTRPPPSTCSPRTPTATACTASPPARGCATC